MLVRGQHSCCCLSVGDSPPPAAHSSGSPKGNSEYSNGGAVRLSQAVPMPEVKLRILKSTKQSRSPTHALVQEWRKPESVR